MADMTVIIPQNKIFSQTNTGEVFGSLYATKNISFDKEGYAQLARRPIAAISGVANFETLVSLSYIKASSNSGYYAMTSARPFKFNLDGSAPSDLNDAVATGSTYFDAVTWQGRWYVSQATAFSYLTIATGAWTGSLGSLTTSIPHPMCVWESANYLCIGNGNVVRVYNTSHTLVTDITLPSNFEVRWIRYNNNKIFIGTKNTTGGDAVMFVCNSTTAVAATEAWPVSATWMWSGVIYKSSIVVCTSRGQLLRFNGGGWDELANFPIYNLNYSWLQGTGAAYTNGRMEQRGMVTDGSLIYLNIDGYCGDPKVFFANQPSGLWIYDPSIGLYHRASASNDKYQHLVVSSVNTTTDVITLTSSTALTGTKAFYHSSANVMTGLRNNTYYFLIRVTATTYKLAISYANALAGTAVDITGAGSGTETFSCSDEIDAGLHTSNSIYEPGAVCIVSELDGNPITYGYMSGSQVLFGGSNFDTATAGTVDTVQSLAPAYNRGYIVTQKIFAPEVKDSFKKLIAKCSRLFQTSDKVIVKYRNVDKINYPLFQINASSDYAVWTPGLGGNTFTTTADLSSVIAGEEIEFTSGRGAGLTAHIVSATNNAGTWTVVIDEAIPGAATSDNSGYAIQNFMKLGVMTSTEPDWILNRGITFGQKKWIQLKIEFRGHSEPILEEAQVINSTQQSSA